MLRIRFTTLVLFTLGLAACSAPTPVITPAETESPTLAPTLTARPTETAVPPTATITPTVPPTLTPTPAYPPEGYGPTDFPDEINPLTGLPAAEPGLLERRPLAFKINLVPRTSTRPPWGLSLADVVFEYYHNAGYSRLHVIYYGNDAELVGPIRSARLLDDPLVQMYKSIFAYGSADQRVNYRLFGSTYSDRLILEGGRRSLCPPTPAAPLCRHDPNGYDILLGGTEQIHAFAVAEGVDDARQDLDGMFFQLEAPPGGEAGDQITTRYSADSYNRWEYDEGSSSYLLFQDNILDTGQGEEFTPLLDRLTEVQISAANVVILFAQHSYFQRPPAEIVEIQLTGSGKGYAFRDGKMYPVTWTHLSPDSLLTLTLEDGEPYPFKPGNTWFQVVGQSTTVTEPASSAWRIEFHLP
ncbi:MAG TPA: DUF3048 C-terminal domain-containing protein [Anaerolineales bacterium]|nr:DUF3048 C-terminal domain-containing protein [Anaerolineales bacterium]